MNRKTIIALLAIIIVLCACAAAYAYRAHRAASAAPSQGTLSIMGTSSPVSLTDTRAASSSASRTVPAGSKEYQDAAYGFSLIYPDDLAVQEYAEGGGASTITFEDVQSAQGFQIFIVPYADSQISEARFEEDEPSGIRDDLSNITVDGAVGASFYSTNLALGDTAEIWFIHGGYLYEVTTLKPLAPWLSGIVETWRFSD